ncbi:MAG: 30S ribosomal protein THX [Lewinella sp.]|nr:30S ribosomal protein THX [Lewinella sp.]
MGKGDKKTAKGKRNLGSHGNSRPKKKPAANTSSTKENKPS